MIKNILVPMGVSQCCKSAFSIAIQLSNIFKASISVLYVEDGRELKKAIQVHGDLPGVSVAEKDIMEVKDKIKKEKEDVKKLCREMRKDIAQKASFISRKGDFFQVIMDEAKSSDIVVMGKFFGKAGTQELDLPVFNIIQHIKKPVIAVSNVDSLGKNILIAYNSSVSANNALKVLGELSSELDPEIFILTIKRIEEEAEPVMKEAEKYLSPYKVKTKKIWKSGNAVEKIIETVKEKEISFVVMGGYGDSKIKEFFLGSATEAVLKELHIPLMICNA